MTHSTPRIDRAIRVTPPRDRSRCAAEWRHDLAAAEAQGLSPRDLERGAMRLALRLRAREFERLLLGDRGPARATGSWLSLLGLLLISWLLGGIVLLFSLIILVALVVVLARAGTPTRWSHVLMVASIATGTASAAFVWWSSGVRFDAADAMQPLPPAAAWGGAALVVFALSALALLTSALVAASRGRRLP